MSPAPASAATQGLNSTTPIFVTSPGGMASEPKFDGMADEATFAYASRPSSMSSGRNIYENRYKDTSKRFRGFWHLMCLWKSSVLKLIWHDLLVFILLYLTLSLIYRYVLFDNPRQREIFELICVYCSRFRHLIPITFLTGFYVTQVVSRYWDQFMALPFPDRVALKLVSFIPGKDSFRRNLRRAVMRYVNLSTILAYRLVSNKVQSRFPDYNSLIESKLLLKHEAERLEKNEERSPHEFTWSPLLWGLQLIQRARTEGKIVIEAPVYSCLVSSFDYIETCNRIILNYGWVNFPLAYTQVATISVFLYLFTSLFACQFIIPGEEAMDTVTFTTINVSFSTVEPWILHTPDIYVPFFTIIEFISYMGWIKVAEALLNPFGDDDEDFQINYLIDRNLQVSYLIVDEAEMPMEVSQDPFLEAGIAVPSELPYKDATQRDEASRKVTASNLDDTDSGMMGAKRMNSIKKGVRKISGWVPTANTTHGSGTPKCQPRRGSNSSVMNMRRNKSNNSLASIAEHVGGSDDSGLGEAELGQRETVVRLETPKTPPRKRQQQSPSGRGVENCAFDFSEETEVATRA